LPPIFQEKEMLCLPSLISSLYSKMNPKCRSTISKTSICTL